MERKRNIQPALAERQRNATAAREAAPRVTAERRNRARHAMTPANSIEAVRLVDLSSNGCCLGFAEAVDYRPGQFVRLGFAGETEAVRAIVRWCEPARIGVEFTTGLTGARIDAILGESRAPLVGLL
jgi:hypothetical protein